MILIDFNGAMIGQIISQKMDKDIDDLRVFVLNELRKYNLKFREHYSKADDTRMVICLEGRSWRKEVFPQYKANRKDVKKKPKLDWENVYSMLNQIVEELRENSPYIFLQHERAEADDCIAAMVKYTQAFGRGNPVLIVSSDSDFQQLQRFKNVQQYSVLNKKMMVPENGPTTYLIENIMRGQSKDGIPNIHSPDDQFVAENSPRQKSVSKDLIAKISGVIQFDLGKLEDFLDDGQIKNFIRNTKMMDLCDQIPKDIVEDIYKDYETQNSNRTDKGKLMPFLMANRHRLLVECVQDFF